MKIEFLRVPIVHFKNPRTKKTLCGHNYSISGRTYSSVTSNLDEVTCKACLNTVGCSKWIKEMIDKKKKVPKSPQDAVDGIIEEMMKSS